MRIESTGSDCANCQTHSSVTQRRPLPFWIPAKLGSACMVTCSSPRMSFGEIFEKESGVVLVAASCSSGVR